MGMTKIAIINGRLADPAGDALVPGAVLIEGDRIVASGDVTLPDDAQRIDAAGLVVAPGLVDLGVFATDKPAFHFGGITRAALMPDQSSLLDDAARASPISGSTPSPPPPVALRAPNWPKSA
jgi:dihydroorotase